MTAFDTVAAFYEVLANNSARLQRETPLLAEVLTTAPGRRVVDLACGTGLHALVLAQLGATVNAIDISLEMIRFATSTRPHPAITYQVGDMRHPTGGPWDMAICLGNSLSLLNSHNEVQNTLHTLYTVLAPDSTFLCQTLNYTSSDAQHPRHRIEEKYSENSTILAAKTLIPRNDHTLLSLAFFAEHNGRYTTRADTAILLHLSDEQITAYAKNAGFSVENKYGDFSKSPYQPNHSPDLIFVLRKPA